NCSGVNLSSTHESGATFPIGNTTVSYTATDASGNSASCAFTVTVVDAQPPVLSDCPANITRPAAAGQCSTTVTWTPPTATDNCGSPGVAASHNPGATFAVGTTTVTYTAMDSAGNTATCSFTVSIVDHDPPVISDCPADATFVLPPGANTATVTWSIPTATDSCSTAAVVQTGGPTRNSSQPVGDYGVTYTA